MSDPAWLTALADELRACSIGSLGSTRVQLVPHGRVLRLKQPGAERHLAEISIEGREPSVRFVRVTEDFGRLLDALPDFVSPADGAGPLDGPRRFAVLLQMIEGLLEHGHDGPTEEAALLFPLVVRAHYLAVSAPFRFGVQHEATAGRRHDARRARERWAARLAMREQDPVQLAHVRPRVEQELRALLFEADGRSVLRLAPPQSGADRSERELIERVIEREAMPRAALAIARKAARGLIDPRWGGTASRLRAGLAAGSPVIVAVTALAAAALSSIPGARSGPPMSAIAVGGLVLAVSLVVGGRASTALAALRMPAGAAIGLFAVLALDEGWLDGSASRATPVLLAGVFGYVALEAFNNGIAWGPALRRSLAVTSYGFAWAVPVALVGLHLIAPALMPEPAVDQALIDRGLGVVAFVASASLALGVFVQVLWEAEPLTAPLPRTGPGA